MNPRRTSAFLFSLALLTTGGCKPLLGGDDSWPDSTCEVESCTAEEVAGDRPTEFTARTCMRTDLEEMAAASGSSLADLDPTTSCDQLLDYVKEVLLRTAKLRLEHNLRRALEVHCRPCYEPGWDGCNGCADSGVSNPDDDPGADDYSETNTQVPGIDEADFVKNDGNYLYLVDQGGLTIVDAWPAADAHTVSTLALPGTPRRLYVHADRAIVYSAMGSGGAPDCTHGYDCEFLGDGQPMTISVIDISDRAAPHLVRQLATNSGYLSSRRIGDIVHTVVMAPPLFLPDLPDWPSDVARYAPSCDDGVIRRSPSEIAAAFQALWAENQARIAAVTLDDVMPTLTERRWIDGVPSEVETRLAVCDQSYLPRTHDGLSLITLMSFDSTTTGEIGLTTVLGRPGAVYASADALYLAQPHQRQASWEWFDDDLYEATTLHKFRLEAGSTATQYAGSGLVKGRVLNQFAMDERDGYLRIATTTGWAWNTSAHNTIATLTETETGLAVAGMLDGLGYEEDIRSVRFAGEVGYMVTFKRTDPLFVIDLSDPVHPRLRGELHIPGFSTYLHMLDADHILSIGFDAQEEDWFAWFAGIMLQVMDVGDLDAPSLLHKEVIGTRGSTSDAATNHLAFNYHAPRQLLAVPMLVCEPSAGGSDYGGRVSFEGLQVYRVTLEEGFTLLGGIPHREPYDLDPWASCGNWWTDTTSPVERSVFLEDWVFSIAADKLQVAPLSDLATPVVTIPR